MNVPFPNLPGGRAIAYVREAAHDDLPAEAQAVPGKVYAIHDEAGNRLAFTTSRDLAFALVRRNDMLPVSVH